MRLIDADALERDGWKMSRTVRVDKNTMEIQTRNPKDFPTIEPQKKHGKWIERESGTEDKENGFETVIVCSCCDFPATTFYSEDCESRTQIRTDFCPNCGSDMRGGQDD